MPYAPDLGRYPDPISLELVNEVNTLLENPSLKQVVAFTSVNRTIKYITKFGESYNSFSNSHVQYLYITHINYISFLHLDENFEDPQKRIRWLYDGPSQILAVKFIKNYHSTAVSELSKEICNDISRIYGVGGHDFAPGGCTASFGDNRTAKEPDASFKPLSRRPFIVHWPTVVIECGDVENINMLRRDTRWWLHTSKGDVNIAILIAIDVNSRVLTLERWESDVYNGPVCTQQTCIKQNPRQQVNGSVISIGRNRFQMSGGAFILPSEKCVLAPAPKRVAGEEDRKGGDVVIDEVTLSLWACTVWLNYENKSSR